MLCYLMLLETEDEKAAFLALYKTSKDLLWTVTGRYFSDQELRADATQDTWLSVARSFKKINLLSYDSQLPYLITIAKNACITILRKEQKFAPMPEDAEMFNLTTDAVWDPDPAGVEGDARRALELMADLPEKYRAVLEARLVLGLGNDEVAKELVVPKTTASSWFERGKKLLAKKLMEEGIFYE